MLYLKHLTKTKREQLKIPDKNNTLYVVTREEWREWLEINFRKKKEIWLVYPKKESGKKRIPYNDAVEEALCFGWIDSIIKTLDTKQNIQRFTPRRPKSDYSQPNRERLKWLAENHFIHSEIFPVVQDIISEEFIFPEDIITQLKKEKVVWDNYLNFKESYKRIRVAYIDDARKRPEEFQKRLSNFIGKTRENKLIIGFGGIEKYY